jgi:hypothetical protein
MHNIRILLLTLVMALVFGTSFCIAAESMDDTEETTDKMCIPMGKITLTPPEGVEAKRSPVEFNHPLHFEINCSRCHHEWDRDEAIVGCTTSGCHELTESPVKAGGSEFEGEPAILYYKNAYHSLCIRCHQEIKADNKKLEQSKGALPDQLPATGPTGCIQCHPKE